MSLAVGVIGGLGPAATIHFMQRVMDLTPARRDQDHVRLIVDNNGGVPDRNAALRGEGPSPGPVLAQMARGLERAGAGLLVMPCNTAHAWADDIRAATAVPFLDLIALAADAAVAKGARAVGVLAADGCMRAELYPRALAARGARAILPDASGQVRFMELLYRIKAGDVGADVRRGVADLAAALVAGGASVLLAGCTEIPLAMTQDEAPAPLIDSLDCLAAAVVARARDGVSPPPPGL